MSVPKNHISERLQTLLCQILTHDFQRNVSSTVIRDHSSNFIDISVPVSALMKPVAYIQDMVSKPLQMRFDNNVSLTPVWHLSW